MPKFDAYTATTRASSPDKILALVCRPGDEVKEARGIHHFGTRLVVNAPSGDQVAMIQFGGGQADLVMLDVKGERTPSVVEQYRQSVEHHRVTRVDSCEDFDRPGAWDDMLATVLDVKKKYNLYGERGGDWDFPEKGRTQYLGSPSSAVRARLYEKGKQPGFEHLNRPQWVRHELQVRPAKEAKVSYSRLDATEVWGASKFSRELAARILAKEVGNVPAGTVYKLDSRERALRWMCRQYGPHLKSLHDDLGDWVCVGQTIGELMKEEQAARQIRRAAPKS